MAIQLTKIGNSPNTPTKDYVCDLRIEIEKLPKVVMGSTCFCLEDKSAWVKGSDEWKEITSPTSSNKELETLEQLIDESGVLESTDGTATEKVEQLIDKADDGNLWYEASKKIKSFAAHQQCPCFVDWAYSRLPRTDFSNIDSMSYAICGTQLEYIDYYINSGKCTNFGDALSSNHKLKWMVGIDLSSATTIFDLFLSNNELETIQKPLNIPNVKNATGAFSECWKLKDIRFVAECIKISMAFYSSVLTDESIQSIIDGLATVETAQTLTLHADVKAKLTEKQLATITGKNWNLA